MQIDIKYKFIALYINVVLILSSLSELSVIFLGNELSILVTLNKIVMILLMLLSIVFIIKYRKFILFLVVTLIWVLLFAVSLSIEPQVGNFYDKAIFYTVESVIIVICLLATVDEPKKLIKAYIPYLYISIIFGILIFFDFIKNGGYSMQFSYYTIVPTVLMLILGLKKKRYWLMAFIIIVIDLLCGSRGCFICLLLSIIFINLFFIKGRNKAAVWIALILLCLLIIVSISNVMNLLYEMFPSSRTIELLAQGDYLHLSGRQNYYENLTQEILNSKFSFHGLYSDRVFMAEYFGRKDVSAIFGSYSHNIFIEVLFQYGLIGIPLLILLVVSTVRSGIIVAINDDKYLKMLFVMYLSYSLGQLLISSSYLTAISFGELIGVVIISHTLNTRKKIKFVL